MKNPCQGCWLDILFNMKLSGPECDHCGSEYFELRNLPQDLVHVRFVIHLLHRFLN